MNESFFWKLAHFTNTFSYFHELTTTGIRSTEFPFCSGRIQESLLHRGRMSCRKRSTCSHYFSTIIVCRIRLFPTNIKSTVFFLLYTINTNIFFVQIKSSQISGATFDTITLFFVCLFPWHNVAF